MISFFVRRSLYIIISMVAVSLGVELLHDAVTVGCPVLDMNVECHD